MTCKVDHLKLALLLGQVHLAGLSKEANLPGLLYILAPQVPQCRPYRSLKKFMLLH